MMRTRVLAVLGMLCALTACGESAAPLVQPSGFLGDYSQLEKGRGDQAQLVYINPEAHFARYDRIIVDPVVVWGDRSGAPPRELQELASAFQEALREQLGKEFELAEVPGPGTLRLRAAITAVHEANASIEVEILDSASGERLVAVADARGDPNARAGKQRASVREALVYWADRARARLAAFRRFDAAEAAHDDGALSR